MRSRTAHRVQHCAWLSAALVAASLLPLGVAVANGPAPYAPLLGEAVGYEPSVAAPSMVAPVAHHALESLPADTFQGESALPYPNLPSTAASPSFDYVDPGVPCLDDCCCPDFTWQAGGKARAFYWNDQRWEFTGQEATFGVEGVIDGGIQHQVGEWELEVNGEFFLNQPFDRNILIDSPERVAFARHYDIDLFQISQLYFSGRRGDLYVSMGRFVTPFGRFYFPNYFNNFVDSPFIRSEAIHFRETGALVQWDPDPFVFTAALTNGGPQQDTNSSKALIARVGMEGDWYAFGSSIKVQDGIGSEHQKTFNQHIGVDAMVRSGRWTLSAEAIYDEYGLRKPGLAPNDITWGRSIYYRDFNRGFLQPFTGFGYYVDLGYRGEKWEWHLNYGDFFPQQTLGIAAHDEAVHRGLVHLSYHFTEHFEAYGIALIENEVPFDFYDRIRYGSGIAIGVQFTL